MPAEPGDDCAEGTPAPIQVKNCGRRRAVRPRFRAIPAISLKSLKLSDKSAAHELRPAHETPTLPPGMAKDDLIEFEGKVIEVLTGGLFRVEVDEDHIVLAHLAGKMRRFRIKVVLGDKVTVAVSPYDPLRGRIVYRAR